MRITELYSGTWMPRSVVHLDELYHFFADGTSKLPLDAKQLSTLRKRLNLKSKEIKRRNGIFAEVMVPMGTMLFSATEDGVFTVRKEVKEVKRDFTSTTDFFLSRVLPAIAYLFSTGAPLPKVYTSIESIMPVVLVASEAHQGEIESLFTLYNDAVQLHIPSKGKHVFLGEKIVLIVTRQNVERSFVNYVVFIQDLKQQMKKTVDMHRVIWEEISLMREKPTIKSKDLPVFSDRLLEIQQEIAYLMARLEQTRSILEGRLRKLHSGLEVAPLAEWMEGDLTQLRSANDYVRELWVMTDRYVSSTLDFVRFLDKENQRRDMIALQASLFIAAFCLILAMIATAGGHIRLFTPEGEVQTIGFINTLPLVDIVLFGSAALVIGFLIYLLLQLTFMRLRRLGATGVSRVRSWE